jgi:hypothetical protein
MLASCVFPEIPGYTFEFFGEPSSNKKFELYYQNKSGDMVSFTPNSPLTNCMDFPKIACYSKNLESDVLENFYPPNRFYQADLDKIKFHYVVVKHKGSKVHEMISRENLFLYHMNYFVDFYRNSIDGFYLLTINISGVEK